ncbi:transposase Tn3 family protein [Candidatus Magnetobacterium bavaricum]|uniref:Transposase Tn3 family protein n=1 Tax=Candidatus Magnetobacterium bavaricum TaxID=29290 RepID=A0A0F3GZN5_9BACT|nr:transposase Tn3 family protein [Candidatus Magnetobacterium bavaricum]
MQSYPIIGELSQKMTKHLVILELIEKTVQDDKLTDGDKVNAIKQLLTENQKQEYASLKKELGHLSKESSRITKNNDYYDILDSKSIKLQNRVSDIIKNIEFDEGTSSQQLIDAIRFYKSKDGIVPNPPLDFLGKNEQSILYDRQGKFRMSLYKVMLFEHVDSGIKSGSLNLRYSYKYRAFNDYLIQYETWVKDKDEFLDKAGLLALKKFANIEDELDKAIRTQFQTTNENIINKHNQHATIGTDGKLKVQTPADDKEIIDNHIDLFPKERFISLFEVLSTVNKVCRFTDPMEHLQVKHTRDKPQEQIFIAGIIGYGCNLGVRKIAKISRNVNANELENTVNWYFTNENTSMANNNILELIEMLHLPHIFKQNQNITHTSSDGQKFAISVESLNANYSYKYFGKGKGVSVYSFIDESHRLFYSTVINSSEREAAYVIDGLLHNDVVQSDIHSTDTHGYSEIVFAVTHLLGISFAPRIKDFRDQSLYSFEDVSILKKLGYPILPNGKINTKIIEEHWDDILRLVVTIRLKESSASQLFRRLSSYSKQHPLYRSLKEFGRIIKTLFLLKYIDDVGLRQSIEKQLNKIESSNKFGKAVFYGNNQEFQQATKDEQLIVDGCKRLIENAIICWNYLYLTKMIMNTQTENEKRNLLDVIRNGSVIVWQHINLQGEYDFSEESLKDSIEFILPDLLETQMV